MPNPNFPGELGSIPYGTIIGGPLNAAVEANADASMTAAKFIQDVGFQDAADDWESSRKPVYVTFSYKKTVIDDESGAESTKEFEMRVPLLLLVNIPYFEVSRVTVDFNVKLNSVQTYATSSKFDIDSEVKGKQGWFTGNVKWKVSASYQKQKSQSQKIERTYDQSVHVEAESVEPPTGVTRVFDVLEETITETETTESSPSP
ncbi:DUF2589 domain-containing protein [Haloplanus natans]|uniref:DUF2589 domain-containing protein n=1 Tax=Haloplanus natans TaxID=376171 RepID=UPI000677CCB3|nr:DUF2589 domain-containing protein [Haloplanus natans]